MLIFGCCVGKSGKFDRVAEPALRGIMESGDKFIREDGREGICAAYNRILLRARSTSECEGVILLHDDTELRNGSRTAILSALSLPNVGVVGAVGGRGLYGPTWYESRVKSGYLSHTFGTPHVYQGGDGWVDVVDGLLIAIAPRAYSTFLFDQNTFPAFHGYDTDYCLTLRNAGLKVYVPPVDYHHHNKTDLGDADAFYRSADALSRKWPDWIRPLTRSEKIRLRSKDLVGRARYHGATTVKALISKR